MKKVACAIIVVVMLVLCFTLSACGAKYVSSYSASLMVKTNTSDKATVSFDSFKGTYVMQLKNNDADEVFIAYNATLGEGNIKVYYDFDGEKKDLFEINTDSSVNAKTETFVGNKTIYIIIESNDKCGDGEFSFRLEKVQN